MASPSSAFLPPSPCTAPCIGTPRTAPQPSHDDAGRSHCRGPWHPSRSPRWGGVPRLSVELPQLSSSTTAATSSASLLTSPPKSTRRFHLLPLPSPAFPVALSTSAPEPSFLHRRQPSRARCRSLPTLGGEPSPAVSPRLPLSPAAIVPSFSASQCRSASSEELCERGPPPGPSPSPSSAAASAARPGSPAPLPFSTDPPQSASPSLGPVARDDARLRQRPKFAQRLTLQLDAMPCVGGDHSDIPVHVSHKQLPQIQQVRSGLFIGTEHVANDKAVLQALGITHILSMNGCTPKWPEEFQYCTVSAADDDQAILLENMVSGVSFIRDALEMGKSVLVHCRKGVNRSGSMLIGYLMMCENISYNQALDAARQVRPCISPRGGMVRQLLLWQDILRHGASHPVLQGASRDKGDALCCQLPPISRQ